MTVVDVAAAPLSDLDHRAQLRHPVIASTVGTTIEWYDFLLSGQMAALAAECFTPRLRYSGRRSPSSSPRCSPAARRR
jgi:hypothetical protein